jgi:addiction module HigA family antidote
MINDVCVLHGSTVTLSMYPLSITTENQMMPKNRMRPIHPGEILREEYLQPLNLTPNALAIALRVPAPRINDIVLERRAITPNTALRLARYFGGDAESWMNLQVAYDLKQAELAEGKQIRTEVSPRAA